MLPNERETNALLIEVWPNIHFGRVNQGFGENPDYYRPFKLPGHEGLDLFAPLGSGVVAPLTGKVAQVGWLYPGHPYGYAIRLQREYLGREYELTLAHLEEGSSLVQVGQLVMARQPLALADSTGNVWPVDDRDLAAHIHVTLKRTGATARGETPFPRDIIDPTEYFRRAYRLG